MNCAKLQTKKPNTNQRVRLFRAIEYSITFRKSPLRAAPTAEGTYTLSCKIDDGALATAPPDNGTRDDAFITRSITVKVDAPKAQTGTATVEQKWDENDLDDWRYDENAFYGVASPVIAYLKMTDGAETLPLLGHDVHFFVRKIVASRWNGLEDDDAQFDDVWIVPSDDTETVAPSDGSVSLIKDTALLNSLASFTPPSTSNSLEPAYATDDPNAKPLEQAFVSALTVKEITINLPDAVILYSPSEVTFDLEDQSVLY